MNSEIAEKRKNGNSNKLSYNSPQDSLCFTDFDSILNYAVSVDVPLEKLSGNSVLQLYNKNSRQHRQLVKHFKSFLILIFSLFFCIMSLLTLVLVIDWPFTRYHLTNLYFECILQNSVSSQINNTFSLEEEVCLLNVPEPIADVFRPPVDCHICQNVTSIEHLSDISALRFEKSYAYSGRPVVVTDATLNWAALNVFNFEFFKSLYAPDSPALASQQENCQFFPYKSNFESLSEVFNMSLEQAANTNGDKPWYIGWSNCDSSAANTLRKLYKRPYFLPKVAESSKTDWIFMGSPGHGAHLHIDNVGNPSWQAQIRGTKQWTLKPPPECYFECKRALKVIVKPGQIIVIDTNKWFHSTLVLGDSLSITIGSEYD